MAGIFGARMKGAWPIPVPADPTGKALISGIPIAPNVTTATTDPAQASANLASADPQWQKPNTLQTIAGIIGDSLTQWRGGQPMFAQMQALRQKAMYEAAMQQRERANKFADWQQQYDYEAGHPKQGGPHFWETNDGSLGAIGGDYGADPKILYKDPTPKVQWYETTDAQTGAKKLTPVWPGMQAQGGDMGGELPQGYTVRGAGQSSVTPAAAGSILSGAASSNVISPAQAAQIRASLGPNGQAAFAQWLAQHKITIGGQ